MSIEVTKPVSSTTVDMHKPQARTPRSSSSAQPITQETAPSSNEAATLELKKDNVVSNLNAVQESDTSEKDKASLSEEDKEQVELTVNELNKRAQQLQRDLEFAVDNDSGRTVITVKDKSTDEVVRQIPSEEVLKLSSKVQELNEGTNGSSGFIINQQA